MGRVLTKRNLKCVTFATVREIFSGYSLLSQKVTQIITAQIRAIAGGYAALKKNKMVHTLPTGFNTTLITYPMLFFACDRNFRVFLRAKSDF